MRHRIKKIPTLSKLHHLLHSDKSTYFYKKSIGNIKGFFSSIVQSFHHRANDIRWTSPHHDKTSSPTETALVNRTRSSRETMSYSVMAGRTPLVLSTFGLLMVLGIMICPLAPTSGIGEAYATGEANNDSNGDISTQMTIPTSGVALELNTTLPEDKTIVEQVTGSGTKYISVNFTVGANDIDKYQVFVQADNSNLVGYTNKDTITSIATPTAGGNLTAKTWGYSVAKNHNVVPSTMTYNTIQTNVSTAADTVEAATGSKLTNITQPYTLAFAANLDGAKADHYKSNITLSVAANAEQVTTSTEFLGFYGINYMQDMTPAICEKARVGEVARLIDKRDQKLYWIGKLADNNCWMTQNLDYDIKQGQVLTSELSDVQADWKPEEGEGTILTGELSAANWPTGTEESFRLIRSYDPGKYVNVMPTDTNNCTINGNATHIDCPTWEEYTGKTVSTDPNFGVATTNTHYNGHYTIGNYYNYSAATAGTWLNLVDPWNNNNPSDISKNDTSGSICPKGWQLPYSGRYIDGNKPLDDSTNNTPIVRNRSFVNLLEAYGWKDWDIRDTWNNPVIRGDTANLVSNPMYWIRSGFLENGNIYQVNFYGYYWSSTAYSLYNGYGYFLGPSDVSPSSNPSSYVGYSIRCVAR